LTEIFCQIYYLPFHLVVNKYDRIPEEVSQLQRHARRYDASSFVLASFTRLSG